MANTRDQYWHALERRPCQAEKFKITGEATGYIFGSAGRPYPSIQQAIENTDVPVIRLPDGREFRTRELLARITPPEHYYLETDPGAKRRGKFKKKRGAEAKYTYDRLLKTSENLDDADPAV